MVKKCAVIFRVITGELYSRYCKYAPISVHELECIDTGRFFHTIEIRPPLEITQAERRSLQISLHRARMMMASCSFGMNSSNSLLGLQGISIQIHGKQSHQCMGRNKQYILHRRGELIDHASLQ